MGDPISLATFFSNSEGSEPTVRTAIRELVIFRVPRWFFPHELDSCNKNWSPEAYSQEFLLGTFADNFG